MKKLWSTTTVFNHSVIVRAQATDVKEEVISTDVE